MAETRYTVTQTTLDGVGYENYSAADRSVVDSFVINSAFDEASNNIELHIYGLDGTLLDSNLSYRGAQQLQGAENGANLSIDPERDALTAGYDQGGVRLLYNFLNNISPEEFFIQEISADRRELKVLPVSPTYDATALVAEIKDGISTGAYFNEFRLNFGGNDLLIGLNIDINNSVLIKLYEPLPSQYTTKSRFTFDEIVSDSVVFEIEAEFIPDAPVYPTLRGANFNLDTGEEKVQPTEYFDYNNLYSYDVTNSLHGVITQLSSSGVELSIDYTSYSNFVHFSSAEERLRNFNYKMGLLEAYNYSASISATYQPQYDNLTKGIISKFDDYEKYLYFKSGSKAWPKTNSNVPYINDTVTNSTNWFNEQVASASLYDELNESRLTYTVPEFIREDSANQPYNLFLDMIGQHFDNLWIYSKAMTDKYNADNRLNVGVSKDLIRDVLKSFGVKLYTSNFSVSNLAASFIGEFYQSGSEVINTFVTASNDPTPDKDILSETYKRIYHNLPYLIKTKGTERGLRALINCFGIPSGSLEITEVGGYKKDDYFFNRAETVDKIRLDNTGSLVSGSTLSQYVSIQNNDEKYTQDSHQIDVAFSPAKYINTHIENQITGSYPSGFNIDEYIGDPTSLSSGSYVDLNKIATTALSGSDRYDVFDFVRLVKFYDNQLFKMVKDFVPARAVATTGITVKPHILNRSKIAVPTPEWSRPEYSGSIDTAFTTGSEGGVIPSTVSTAYTASFSTLSGSVNKIINNNSPQFNGELGGTVLTVTTQSLNIGNPLLNLAPTELPYYSINYYDYASITAGDVTGSLAAGEIRVAYFNYGVLDDGIIPTLVPIFIRINTTTSTGEDITLALTQATTIEINGYTYRPINTGTDPYQTDALYISLGDGTLGSTTPMRGVPSNATGKLCVIRPFINLDITYSNYNALLSNASKNQFSSKYQTVDNTSNQLIPSNLSAINTRTAGFAQIQDGNYSISSYKNIRYDGVKHTADDFNLQSSTGLTPVEQNSAYFGYFKTIARTSPELHKKTEVSLDYLFDLAGNRITLDNSETATAIVQQNFSQGSFVKLALDDPKATGENMTEINGLKKVHKPGKYVEYITGTGVTLGVFTSSISFTTDDNITDYTFLAVGSSNQPLTFPTQLQFNTVEHNPASYYSSVSDSYTFGEDSEAQIAFRVQGTFQNNEILAHDFTISIKLDSNIIATKTVTVGAISQLDFDLASNYRYFLNAEEITVEASSTADVLGSVLAGVEFDLVQNPVAKLSISRSNLWSTGSASSNILTGSSALASVYGNRVQAPNQGTTFPTPVLPFTVEIGDEFRFDGNELNTYIVANVVKSGKVYIELDRDIPSQININNFTHRRYIGSSKHILLDTDKPVGATTGGIIVPQYMDASAEESIGKVISNLRERGII